MRYCLQWLISFFRFCLFCFIEELLFKIVYITICRLSIDTSSPRWFFFSRSIYANKNAIVFAERSRIKEKKIWITHFSFLFDFRLFFSFSLSLLLLVFNRKKRTNFILTCSINVIFSFWIKEKKIDEK